MNVTFKKEWLDRLANGQPVKTRFSAGLVAVYLERIGQIIRATDERDLRSVKGNHFEKLVGDRTGQYSIRLNSQFRLVFEIRSGTAGNTIHILDVVDYH